MTRIRVVVTQADIDAAGTPLTSTIDATRCPLACALRRRGYHAAAVGFTFWSDGTHDYPLLSDSVRRFVSDYGIRPVEPSVFYLEGPDR